MGTGKAVNIVGRENQGGAPSLDRRYINGQNRHIRAGVDTGTANRAEDKEQGEDSSYLPHGRVGRQVVQRASLSLTPMDVLVQRVGLQQGKCAPSPPPKRGKITSWSRRSRQGLKLALRGIEGLTHLVSLTYGADYPTAADVIRNHWERIRKWFTRRGFQGVWRREVQKRGAIHYHILIGGADELDVPKLGRAWERITGSADPTRGVHVSAIRSQEKIAVYLSKVDEMATEGEAVGRYWGTFGGAQIAIKAEVVGDAAAIAKIARVARHIERTQRQKARLRPRRDNGQWGRVVWGVAKVLNTALPRLIELFGIADRINITFSPTYQAKEPASPAQSFPPFGLSGGEMFGRGGWLRLRNQMC